MGIEYLRQGFLLKERYRVVRKLGQGGFGITYLAMDLELNQYVVVKECFPLHLVVRDEESGKVKLKKEAENQIFEKDIRKFLDEARRMAKLQYVPEIAKVLGFFRENETAYIVMEYVQGTSLRKYLERLDEPLTFEQAKFFLQPVMWALKAVHKKGLIHRDITPDNIMVLEDRKVKIIDFGSSREYLDDKTKTILVKSGYAPLEQYSGKEKQGPWTDVYGVCAVLYEMITGAAPQDSLSRMESDELYLPSMYGVEIEPEEERVLMKGLSQNYQQRYQNMKQLEKALEQAGREKSYAAVGQKNHDGSKVSKKNVKQSIKKKAVLAGCVLAAGLYFLGGKVTGWLGGRDKTAEQEIYAGNYDRGSQKHKEYLTFIKEQAIEEETTEDGIYYLLPEEAVLTWGEPCNQMHFSMTVSEWLEKMAESGMQLERYPETKGVYVAEVQKYGAILTIFEKQELYIWKDFVNFNIYYDPVNEKLMKIRVSLDKEAWQNAMIDSGMMTGMGVNDSEVMTGTEVNDSGMMNGTKVNDSGIMNEIVTDVMLLLSAYTETDREGLLKSVAEGTDIKGEKKGDVYYSTSITDVSVTYLWSEVWENVVYECIPYSAMSYGMNHSYYWP